MKKLQDLLDKVEIYQDVDLPDGQVIAGKRSVDDRYELIKPHLRHGLYFDIGSNFGGFSRRIARDYDSVVVSFEADPTSAEIQRILLEMHKIENVILVNSQFNMSTMKQIMEPVELIDGFLFLNVLHHLPPQTGTEILAESVAWTPSTFVEVPSVRDKIACGRGATESINNILPSFGFESIGSTHSHTGEDRTLSVRLNAIFSRGGLSYYRSPTEKTHKYGFHKGTWAIDGLEYNPVVGINLWNALHLGNVIYPSREALASAALTAYQNVIDSGVHVEDIRPWNVIFTPDGMGVIDYSDRMNGKDDFTFSKLTDSILGHRVNWDED